MSEKDFDKGYKSGFQFGKEVANEKWLNKVKQAREEIEQNAYPIVHGVNNHDMGMTLNGIFQVLDKLIESEGVNEKENQQVN